jgi:hypothetical protein
VDSTLKVNRAVSKAETSVLKAPDRIPKILNSAATRNFHPVARTGTLAATGNRQQAMQALERDRLSDNRTATI